MAILLDTAIIHNLPALALKLTEAQHCPAIPFVHGFGGNRQPGPAPGDQLARPGCGNVRLE
jgi:hypothetical protein